MMASNNEHDNEYERTFADENEYGPIESYEEDEQSLDETECAIPRIDPPCCPSCFRVCFTLWITLGVLSLVLYLIGATFVRNSNMICKMQGDVNELEQFLMNPIHANADEVKVYVAALVAKGIHEINSKVGELRNMQYLSKDLHGGLVNYAAEELGAKIVKVQGKPLSKGNYFHLPLGPSFTVNPPVNMLRPSMAPGYCFGFQGDKAEVTIKLAKAVVIEEIELEHILAHMIPNNDTTSAPKVFKVYGVDENVELIGVFNYKNQPHNLVEKYAVNRRVRNHIISVKFDSNHGNPNFTCVYRFAVYGQPETE